MHIKLAGLRHIWRVIDYLQHDAASKGALRCNDGIEHLASGSFWFNMDEFMPAFREDRLYVVLDTRHRLIAYCITHMSLENNGYEGTLPIDIFEVLHKSRGKGIGSFMVSWLKDKACAAGFHSLKVLPANGSDIFWDKNGFSAWGHSHGHIFLPIA